MKTWFCHNLSESDQSVKWKVSTRWVHRKKIDAYNVDGFYGHCNTVFEAMGCYYQYCPCQETRTSLTDEEIQKSIRKRELDELRKQYIQEKVIASLMYECYWWNMYKTKNIVKHHLRETFYFKVPLREEKFLEIIKSGTLFCYVQCDFEVPENL